VAEGVVVVTGASRGIGHAIAQELDGAGYDLALVARDGARLEAVRGSLARGERHHAYVVDVGSPEDVAALVGRIREEMGEIYGLVNNAGITRDGLLVRLKIEDWQAVVNTNLNGTFYFTRAVAPFMMRRRIGRIINISSVIGLTGNAGQANYAASKAAIIALTKSVAKELGSRGVTANAVAPGFIDTDMTADLPESVKEGMLKQIPLRRHGEGRDVAGAVKFLLSPDASYITGQVLVVDGGMVA
jgi:3-oxoacyl-[acyl-carrier protein] reductase